MKKIFLICSLFSLLLTTVTQAQTKPPVKRKEIVADGKVYQIANQVNQQVLSPFCPGKTLAMCTSPAAADVRRDIQVWAAQGKKVDEIKETLFEEYGEEYRMAEPPWWDNFGLFIGIGFAFLLFASTIVFISKGKKDSNKTSEDDEDNEDASPDDAYLDELRSQYQD